MILQAKQPELTNDVQFLWVSQGNRPVIAFPSENEAVAWKVERDERLVTGVLPTLRLVKRVVQYQEVS
jgi:hypothetical protein